MAVRFNLKFAMVATSPSLVDLIPPRWRDALSGLHEKLINIEAEIGKQVSQGKTILPDKNSVFAALSIAPEKVRVVIVGQDPYPDRRYAIGRSFAVPRESAQLPPSLKNIIKEKIDDVGGKVPNPDLMEWEEQGVMLLNRTLTVNEGESNSHESFGWLEITTRICQVIANSGGSAILWGKNANELSYLFPGRLVTGVHPSPLSAHRGFFGSMPFSRINQILDDPIQW